MADVKNEIVNVLTRHPDLSYQEIGTLVGLSKQSVHKIVRQAGLKRNVKVRHRRDDISVEKVLDLYHQGLLIKDIAKALGCNVATVRRRLRIAGISKSQCYSRSMKLNWRGKKR